MRIIAINRFYRPDHSATSQLLGELAERLAGEGNDVLIVTGRAGYERAIPLPETDQISGVRVWRVAATKFGRHNLVGRAVDYLTFYISASWRLFRLGRRGDVVIVKTDPPLMCVPAGLIARFRGMTTVNWCQDLFPEVAGALGLKWATGPVGDACRWARNRALKRASFNAVLHEIVRERLIEQGVPEERIRVLPNWANQEVAPKCAKDNALRREWGFDPDTFVIGYSGNLGRAHLPNEVARLVQQTSSIPNLAWLFIGGGEGLGRVKEMVKECPNVFFKPYQPREALGESLSVPDMHLISLSPACEGYIVPSKFAGARAAGRPVLFLGDRNGAVARDLAGDERSLVLDPERESEWKSKVVEYVSKLSAMFDAPLHPVATSQAAIGNWVSALMSQRIAT